MDVRKLVLDDMGPAALVHRESFDAALPSLRGLHTPAEDKLYFLSLYDSCDCWGGFENQKLGGILVRRGNWIEQLYVLPHLQGKGIGGRLLDIAMEGQEALSLWTFVQNESAQAFYERRGFSKTRETDGSENEEGAPALLYQWEGRRAFGP